MTYPRDSGIWKFALSTRSAPPRRSFSAAVAAVGSLTGVTQAALAALVLPKRKVGFLLPSTVYSENQILELGAAAERNGFAQLIVHAPDVQPLRRLSAGAPRLVLGLQAECPTVSQDPVQLAENLAQLACAAPNRAFVGFGLGQEAGESGLSSWQQHTERMVEAVQILRWLWSGELVNFNGKHWAIRNTRLAHPPSEKIPVLLAAHGSRTARLAGQWGDGWVTDAEGVRNQTLRKAFEEGVRSSGREPAELEIVVEHRLTPGNVAEAVQSLHELYAAGATTVLIQGGKGDPGQLMDWYGAHVLPTVPDLV